MGMIWGYQTEMYRHKHMLGTRKETLIYRIFCQKYVFQIKTFSIGGDFVLLKLYENVLHKSCLFSLVEKLTSFVLSKSPPREIC